MSSRKKQDPTEELRKIIKSKHKRTGKPEHWTLEQMKSIWRGDLLAPSKKEDFIESFNKMITSEPKRKGKPKLATPQEMKSIWRTVK